MSDGYVGLPTDLAGKKVDTAELTVGSNTVERQRVVIADNADPSAIAPASVRGLLVEMLEHHETQLQILAELRTMNLLLAHMSGVNIDSSQLLT